MTERFHFDFSLSCIGEGNGNPLQCFCLENPRDGGAWWASVYGVAQSQTWLKWLSSSSSIRFHIWSCISMFFLSLFLLSFSISYSHTSYILFQASISAVVFSEHQVILLWWSKLLYPVSAISLSVQFCDTDEVEAFPGDASGKEPACPGRRCKRCRFSPWVGKILWKRKWQTTTVFLHGESSWTEEPGGLWFIGSQSVGYDWSDLALWDRKCERVLIKCDLNLRAYSFFIGIWLNL